MKLDHWSKESDIVIAIIVGEARCKLKKSIILFLLKEVLLKLQWEREMATDRTTNLN